MKFSSSFFAIIASVLIAACSEEAPPDAAQRAAEIAQNMIIVDTHLDVPYRLEEQWEDVSVAAGGGNFDYPRALAGGLNAPFLSVYTPAALGDGEEATANANKLIDMIEGIVESAPDKFALATSVADVEANSKAGLISFPLGMENGSPIAGDLDNLEHFYKRGIRYITLTHSLSNHIADSSYDDNKQWQGLSPFGEEVVAGMNRLGIMVDVSHVSDDAFWDVLAVSKTPVIATHSSLRYFTPGFERNLSDDMVKALAEKGGVVMINFGSAFLTQDANQQGTAFYAAYGAWLEQEGLVDSGELSNQFRAQYFSEQGYPYATMDQVLDHFDRVVKIAGIDYVGIGSDYDGVGDSLPVGLKDVSMYPNLIKGLLDRGYSEEDIGKILSGNIFRVWRAVEDYAAVNSE
ncbi:MAG: dipeptidase [Proteobacteria bacterium]|nr:dipeptidase [Pseudomonadota bacterium]